MAEMLCIFDLGFYNDAGETKPSFYVTENLCTIVETDRFGIFVIKTDHEYARDKTAQKMVILDSGLMLPSDYTRIGNNLYTKSTSIQVIYDEITMLASPIDFCDIADYYSLDLEKENEFTFVKTTFDEVRRVEYAASEERNYAEYVDLFSPPLPDSVDETGVNSEPSCQDQNETGDITEDPEDKQEQTEAQSDQGQEQALEACEYENYDQSEPENPNPQEGYDYYVEKRCDREETHDDLGSFGFDLSTFTINRPTEQSEPIDLSTDSVQCGSVSKDQKVRTKATLKASTFSNPKAKSTLSKTKQKPKAKDDKSTAKKGKKKNNNSKINYSATGLDSIAHLNNQKDFIGVLRSSKEHKLPGVFKKDSYYKHGNGYAHIVDGIVCITDEKVKFWACQSKFSDPNGLIKKSTALQILGSVKEYMKNH